MSSYKEEKHASTQTKTETEIMWSIPVVVECSVVKLWGKQKGSSNAPSKFTHMENKAVMAFCTPKDFKIYGCFCN